MNDAVRDIPVLLVEDNCDDEWIAKMVLRKIGIRNVTVAHDGCEALQLLHGDERMGIQGIPVPAIIFLDLKLPKLDGLEVLRQIRRDERTKNGRVVILTSSEDPHDKEICRELGITAFLSKPLKVDDMINLQELF